MAVITVQPTKKSGGWNKLWQRTYGLTYRVTCNVRTDGPVVIRYALLGGNPWLPRMGSSYYVNATEKDPWSFLNNVSYDLVSAGANPEHAVWDVACDYQPFDTGTFGADPTAWPVKIQFGGTKFERIVWVDAVTGLPYVNSAGDRFNPAPVGDDSRSQILVVRNELVSTFDWSKAEASKDSVNAAAWNGYAAKTVKVGIIATSDPQYDSNSGRYYFAVSYPFEVNRDTWVDRPVDQGYATLAAGVLTRIFDAQGQPPNEPVKLDGSGGRLAVGAPAVLLSFNNYPVIDFGAFNIVFATLLGR